MPEARTNLPAPGGSRRLVRHMTPAEHAIFLRAGAMLAAGADPVTVGRWALAARERLAGEASHA